ncbi:hypothetical protein RGR602_CH01906 [Rhizobium gallicum bv. gallicum R602sp]|uniref:Uncharacterized protein n=1 Tax=Rhizobium gallicum bv. gallicum R602sp TaxID=1041138 RepID=A0A0B4X3X8_9HYPH|nr:hypothetical protein RGR602_CH01906 [Rhizobium gallicum bv. gallicum R602sp]TDW34748.1 hypothetical protein EV128_10319 [Rhizobium azibense]
MDCLKPPSGLQTVFKTVTPTFFRMLPKQEAVSREIAGIDDLMEWFTVRQAPTGEMIAVYRVWGVKATGRLSR